MNLNSSIKATIAAATYVNAAAVRTLRQCLCSWSSTIFKSTTCSKALGVGISKEFSFHDVEVKKDENGKPFIEYGDFRTHLTISHTDTTVVAFVVLEKGD